MPPGRNGWGCRCYGQDYSVGGIRIRGRSGLGMPLLRQDYSVGGHPYARRPAAAWDAAATGKLFRRWASLCRRPAAAWGCRCYEKRVMP